MAADPDWQLVRRLLALVQRVPKQSEQDTRGRRGWGAVPSGSSPATRPSLTVHRWHNRLLRGGSRWCKSPCARPHRPTSEADDDADHRRLIGYTAPTLPRTSLLLVLLQHVLVFDKGIVGPGALAPGRYLCGGNLSLSAPPSPAATNKSNTLAHLPRLMVDIGSTCTAHSAWRRQHGHVGSVGIR